VASFESSIEKLSFGAENVNEVSQIAGDGGIRWNEDDLGEQSGDAEIDWDFDASTPHQEEDSNGHDVNTNAAVTSESCASDGELWL
jgi:hypothetical protein